MKRISLNPVVLAVSLSVILGSCSGTTIQEQATEDTVITTEITDSMKSLIINGQQVELDMTMADIMDLLDVDSSDISVRNHDGSDSGLDFSGKGPACSGQSQYSLLSSDDHLMMVFSNDSDEDDYACNATLKYVKYSQDEIFQCYTMYCELPESFGIDSVCYDGMILMSSSNSAVSATANDYISDHNSTEPTSVVADSDYYIGNHDETKMLSWNYGEIILSFYADDSDSDIRGIKLEYPGYYLH